MLPSMEKSKNVELINNIFQNLSETGQIMVITYSGALMDAQLADKRTRPTAESLALVAEWQGGEGSELNRKH